MGDRCMVFITRQANNFLHRYFTIDREVMDCTMSSRRLLEDAVRSVQPWLDLERDRIKVPFCKEP
jgi:hypothetical protein